MHWQHRLADQCFVSEVTEAIVSNKNLHASYAV